VLIVGETARKELVARAIHYNSERSDRPFVAVNCGALTESLLESELFGHVKGAFTGAIANQEGFFRKADKGTLFLDEISEVSHSLQVKLLRAIQEREVIPVGGREPLRFDVRLIAATNSCSRRGEERHLPRDLFYRINVITIPLPPLRDQGRVLLAKPFRKSTPSSRKPSVKILRSHAGVGQL
jgi:transcriptional regulator with GAF, ATPase, and Fis domain